MKADSIRNNEKRKEFEEALREQSLRNYTLWRTLFLFSARVSDILKLKVKDIRNEGGKTYKKVRRKEKKTGNYRTYHLPESLRSLLDEYIEKEGLKQEDYLFPSPYNGKDSHLSRQQVDNILKKAADKVGIEAHVSSHTGRKTMGWLAWQRLANNPDTKASPAFVLILLQSMFQHKSPKTTLEYIGVSEDMIGHVVKEISEL